MAYETRSTPGLLLSSWETAGHQVLFDVLTRLEDQIRMFMAVQAPLFEVLDLGVDVPASKFVEEAKRFRADMIALSALMTTTMPQQWV
jgi:hypothetical protein